MQGERVRTRLYMSLPPPFPTMSSPAPSVVNVPAIRDDAGLERIYPATSIRMGSITYDQG